MFWRGYAPDTGSDFAGVDLFIVEQKTIRVLGSGRRYFGGGLKVESRLLRLINRGFPLR